MLYHDSNDAMKCYIMIIITGDLLLPRLQPREAQHKAGGAVRGRDAGGGEAERGAGGPQGGADDQRDQHLQVGDLPYIQ